MENQAYLAFGTARNSPGAKRELKAPWNVYAVSPEGPPSYFRLIKSGRGGIRWHELRKGTDEFNKIDKWMRKRRILSTPDARCHVTRDIAHSLLERLALSSENLH